MRKNQLPSWSVEMHNWLAEKRSLFRVVEPKNFRLSLRGSQTFSGRAELASSWDSGGSPLVYRWLWIDDHLKNRLFFKYLYGISI
jgi:hypothetical protein